MSKMCIVCHIRSAAVPDRTITGRPVKKICRECHADRLRSDLAYIVEVEVKKARAALAATEEKP